MGRTINCTDKDAHDDLFTRLLVLHKYPPDRRSEAIRLVIEQMESMASMVAAA